MSSEDRRIATVILGSGIWIEIHPAAEGGYWTSVSGALGVGSQGETVWEAIENTQDAIEAVRAVKEEDSR